MHESVKWNTVYFELKFHMTSGGILGLVYRIHDVILNFKYKSLLQRMIQSPWQQLELL